MFTDLPDAVASLQGTRLAVLAWGVIKSGADALSSRDDAG